MLKQLNLFLDDNVIICCEGRLRKVPTNVNDSILSTQNHWFSTLLIMDHHCHVHHNGIQNTLILV